MAWLILQIFFWITGAFWLLATAEMLRSILSLRHLPTLQSLPQPPPTLSVMIAVRDEATRIEKTVRQVLAQQGVDLQLIVVNDRSRDATPQILSKLAQEFAQLKVITIDHLPENWLGKCHAMHVGAHYANGEWLLFTDGDVWLAPDVAARAIAAAQAMNVDHITLAPRQHMAENRQPGALYQSVMLMFGMVMNVHLGRANRDRPNSMAGIGAFNLIRKDMYEKTGGHQALRLEVADDMKLGLLVRRANPMGKSRALLAEDAVECDWAASVGGINRALEKNMWSGLNFNLPLAILLTFLLGALWIIPFVALFYLPRPSAVLAALGLPLLILIASVQAAKNRWRLWPALLVPIAGPIIAGVLWNSILTTLRQGGIRWRDTFYPLSLLRSGLVR
ncbi:MAG TPA: glycosyltransferase family 2 protein [Tepidisphaeraceae bacterium]|nr:glycosyltransferase family 2 protein [Tepidisphaeraceae bacterium]